MLAQVATNEIWTHARNNHSIGNQTDELCINAHLSAEVTQGISGKYCYHFLLFYRAYQIVI